ncbi:universal stress protein [Roseisalinus antarcticus]|uniref:Universal stress protein family protein n=1 Tax=Roseisalinus antarcticus TaxID=254357 RepID=A0A1Y5SB12_9RHOB|nr:universal stress protein [Roseisalinus antarcticus]SLN33968.1 Universal stress protein family protein [Roseisalinus antarcticus]
MAIKSIATVVTDIETDGDMLKASFSLAYALDAHLDIYCLSVDTARYGALPAGSMGVVIETDIAATQERASDLAAWAEKATPAGSYKVTVEPLILPSMGLDNGLSRLLRFADLAIAPRPYGEAGGMLQVQVLESALFQRGVPCLVLPPGQKSFAPPSRITLAWDDSTESLAAVRQAMPFLKSADLVNVVMIDPPRNMPDRSDPGGMIGTMLARHGVHCEISVVSQTMPRVADTLMRFCAEHECQAVVMGAYNHSRIREAIVGGPTRDMLQEADVPLLMAH